MKNDRFEVDNLPNFLLDANCSFHHEATARGYVSRKKKTVTVEPYAGKFGEGFKVLLPDWRSTSYCKVYYWIKRN